MLDGSTPRQTRVNPRKLQKYYNRQNALIDAYLNNFDGEAFEAVNNLENGPKVKFAIYASFSVNAFLFVIQLYVAMSTDSPPLPEQQTLSWISCPQFLYS